MRDRFSGTSLATRPWGPPVTQAAQRAPTAVGARTWTPTVKMGKGRLQEAVARVTTLVGAGTVMTLVLVAPRENPFTVRATMVVLPAAVATPGGPRGQPAGTANTRVVSRACLPVPWGSTEHCCSVYPGA